ncbi:cytochrome c oxidase subunit 3 [Azohydromonas australica]|uniref:cytochrome c oxidase subunit 3 n=1 Tax=Azohydromonas australica TaxID=364039 RepID=UPI00040C960F|nr:cytochrome c oxidase subunit 3 [Azohydromonas australica]
MSASADSSLVRPPIAALSWDDRRGSASMLWFIATEAMLFVALFFAYFYLGALNSQWPLDEPPKLLKASAMLLVLLTSSAVLWKAEQASKAGNTARARLWLGGTIVLGLVFIAIQVSEYREHLRKLKPSADAYASIFYTITSFHALHLIVGLLMLSYVLFLPDLEGKEKPPHRPLHNAGLYWHFVDTVWVLVVALLYVLPNLHRS